MPTKKDPANYRALSVPFESKEKANEAIENFYGELDELRKKYKIPDILIVLSGDVMTPSGEEGQFTVNGYFGSGMNQLPLAAYVYGTVKSEFEDAMNKLAKGKK